MRELLGNSLLFAMLAPWQSSMGFVPSHQTTKLKTRQHHGLVSPLHAITFDPRWGRGNAERPKNRIKNEDRFERTATRDIQSQAPCIMEIDGVKYNMTAWAKAHPGGEKILMKFHNKDASKAFHAAGHSKKAYEMLKDFAIIESSTTVATPEITTTSAPPTVDNIPRWRKKLFTKEDPIGIHKYMGIFVLLHFLFRFRQMYFGDPSCGLGTRLGKGPSIGPALCLIPHAVLSLSSLIFHTVPKERVVGKPMIWQEFRLHNIAFGVRSVVAAALAWMSYYSGHNPALRRLAIWGSCASVLLAQYVADLGTKHLRVNNAESTTATMPYWEGCSVETQVSMLCWRFFKVFYVIALFPHFLLYPIRTETL